MSDAPFINSEISQKDSKKDDFIICWANVIRGSESCI